jgi:hypothetical protein
VTEKIVESPRKRRVCQTRIDFERPGVYDVTVKVPDVPEQKMEVTIGPGEAKTVVVRLPGVR